MFDDHPAIRQSKDAKGVTFGISLLSSGWSVLFVAGSWGRLGDPARSVSAREVETCRIAVRQLFRAQTAMKPAAACRRRLRAAQEKLARISSVTPAPFSAVSK